MFVFKKNYFFLTVLLFTIEILIALFFNDRFVRPYVGDYLVVILIYCFLRAFFKVPVFGTAIFVLLFAYIVEILQYLNLVSLLGLQDSKLANIIIGNSFQWIDLVAYTLGIITVLLIERLTGMPKEKIYTTNIQLK